MDLDKRIDDLVEAGWHVLDTDCDERALLYWKEADKRLLYRFSRTTPRRHRKLYRLLAVKILTANPPINSRITTGTFRTNRINIASKFNPICI